MPHNGRKIVLGLFVLCPVPPLARAAAPLCPNGEITLGPGLLRALRRADGTGTVTSTRGSFVLPTGAAISPDSEPVVFAIVTTTTGLGSAGGPGTVALTCAQSTIQVNPPAPDCTTQTFPADRPPTPPARSPATSGTGTRASAPG